MSADFQTLLQRRDERRAAAPDEQVDSIVVDRLKNQMVSTLRSRRRTRDHRRPHGPSDGAGRAGCGASQVGPTTAAELEQDLHLERPAGDLQRGLGRRRRGDACLRA